jgi:hypothetical protein
MYLKLCFIALAFISGCATQLTQQDCQKTNWAYKGERDGTAGVYLDQLDKYQEQCTKYNIAVDQQAYQFGYQKGLKQYCTFSNGQTLGINGYGINKVCPNNEMLELEKGHMVGYEIFQAKQQLRAEMQRAKDEADREIKRSQEEALRAMKQCSFDSDCGPNMRCSSEYKSIGSVSGMVDTCKVR